MFNLLPYNLISLHLPYTPASLPTSACTYSVGLPQFRENTALLYKGVKMFLIVTAVCPGTRICVAHNLFNLLPYNLISLHLPYTPASLPTSACTYSVGLPQFRENTALLYKGVKMFLIVTAVCPGTTRTSWNELDICLCFGRYGSRGLLLNIVTSY